MTTRRTRQLDDETIIAKYNECKDAYDEWDLPFKSALVWLIGIMGILIKNYLIDCRIDIYLTDCKNSASESLLEIINSLIYISDLTFAIMLISTIIALIFSLVKFCRYNFWDDKFQGLEEKRRQ